MIKSLILNKYLAKEFLKVTLNFSFVFICLGFVLNLFEEINFFKDYNVGFDLPIYMSILFVPSLFYNMFPFVILLSGIWFFLKMIKSDEIIALRVSGVSNFSVILVPSILSVIIGIFFITSISPITSVLVKKYENIKGSYEMDQEYLAAVTVNGIWIKEKDLEKNNIIRATKLENNKLIDLSIYEFDKNSNFIKRIEAKIADISTLNWELSNIEIIDKEGNLSKLDGNLFYLSMYDVDKIKSLYSNLDTISFWGLKNEIKLLENRGYSPKEVKAKLQKSLAFPFFLLGMIFLSGVFTLGMASKDSNWRYIFIAIITSVVIFYFNDFSAALGKTEKLPIIISVWMPILIILIFGSVGLIHANQK
jgi:lipopolysaccharide export system permease protein